VDQPGQIIADKNATVFGDRYALGFFKQALATETGNNPAASIKNLDIGTQCIGDQQFAIDIKIKILDIEKLPVTSTLCSPGIDIFLHNLSHYLNPNRLPLSLQSII
jgi:hypothetical protein